MTERKLKVAKIKSDEWMVVRMVENEDEEPEIEYMTSRLTWSKWKSDWKIYFSEWDATSALIIKRTRWEIDTTSKVEEEGVERQSWSEF